VSTIDDSSFDEDNDPTTSRSWPYEIDESEMELASGIFKTLIHALPATRINTLLDDSLPTLNGGYWFDFQALIAISQTYKIVSTVERLTMEQQREVVEMLWAERTMLATEPMEFIPKTLTPQLVRLVRITYDGVFTAILCQELLSQ
jgi:hypothetical protein